MSIPEKFNNLVGEWKGFNKLYTTWIEENPVSESESVASVEKAANGKFLKIEYDWTYENKREEGLLLIGIGKNSDEAKAFWIDSWHMGDKFMVSDGTISDTELKVKGFYEVPEHPDWGWQTDIFFTDENSFKIKMYNVSPENDAVLAVETEYLRL